MSFEQKNGFTRVSLEIPLWRLNVMVFDLKRKERVVLSIFAHPDDAELSCGGTLSRLIHSDFSCYVLALTQGNLNDYERQKGIRLIEASQSADVIGFEFLSEKLIDGRVSFDAETVKCVSRVIDKIKPSILITHYPQQSGQDHQDHLNTSRAVLNSSTRRNYIKAILYAEPATFMLDYSPNYFVDISSFFNKKLEALSKYKSQSDKQYFQSNFLREKARSWSMRYNLPNYNDNEPLYESFFVVKDVW